MTFTPTEKQIEAAAKALWEQARSAEYNAFCETVSLSHGRPKTMWQKRLRATWLAQHCLPPRLLRIKRVLLITISDIYEDDVEGRDRTVTVCGLRLRWPFPVVAMLNSSAAIVFGCPVYGGKKRRWVKSVHRVFTRISDAKYWVLNRAHPRYRFHVVNTGLAPGYHDYDDRILHAAMALLGGYIKDMGGIEGIDRFNAELRDSPDPHAPEGVQDAQADRQSEAAQIWRWWTVERQADKKRKNEMLHLLYGDGRVSWVPTDNPHLNEMKFTPFDGDEIAMNEEFRRLERKIDDDEQTMLHRLIDIRQSLWT